MTEEVEVIEQKAKEYVKAFTDRSHIWSNDKLMQLQLGDAFKDGANLILSELTEKDKQIEELKKINTEGLSELNHINGDLIIENEKLKKRIEELEKRVWRQKKKMVEKTKKISELEEEVTKLTKAKEIIKDLLADNTDWSNKLEAEQFLKEEEK